MTMQSCPVPNCAPLPDCNPSQCARCQTEDAAERVAIVHDGLPLSSDEWRAAINLALAMRQPGQRRLAVG